MTSMGTRDRTNFLIFTTAVLSPPKSPKYYKVAAFVFAFFTFLISSTGRAGWPILTLDVRVCLLGRDHKLCWQWVGRRLAANAGVVNLFVPKLFSARGRLKTLILGSLPWLLRANVAFVDRYCGVSTLYLFYIWSFIHLLIICSEANKTWNQLRTPNVSEAKFPACSNHESMWSTVGYELIPSVLDIRPIFAVHSASTRYSLT